MTTSKLERLLFAQGGRCFFCSEPLERAHASVEHLMATANGGRNDDENCVACCITLNRLLGSMSLKEKLQVVLNQRGKFKCPNRAGHAKKPGGAGNAKAMPAPAAPAEAALADLQRRGTARPRSLKTLKSTLSALFKKTLTDEQLEQLIAELQATGLVSVTEQRVSYAFPQSDA